MYAIIPTLIPKNGHVYMEADGTIIQETKRVPLKNKIKFSQLSLKFFLIIFVIGNYGLLIMCCIISYMMWEKYTRESDETQENNYDEIRGNEFSILEQMNQEYRMDTYTARPTFKSASKLH